MPLSLDDFAPTQAASSPKAPATGGGSSGLSLSDFGPTQKNQATGVVPTPQVQSMIQNTPASPDTSSMFSKITGGIRSFWDNLNGQKTVDGVTAPIAKGGMDFPIIGSNIKSADILSKSKELDDKATFLKLQNQNLDTSDRKSVDDYNSQVTQFKSDIEKYNKNVSDYNVSQKFNEDAGATQDIIDKMVAKDPTQQGFLGTLKSSFIPTQFINSGDGSFMNSAREKVNEQYAQEHPILSSVAQAIGMIANLVLIGKAGGGFGLSQTVRESVPGLSNLLPTATRIVGLGAESGSIFGIQNFLSTAIHQIAQKEFSTSELALKTAQGAATGFALGGAGALPSYAGRIAAGGITLGGLQTLETYVKNGKLTAQDITPIIVNTIVGAGFEALGGREKSDIFKAQEMADIGKEKTIQTILSNHPEMSRADAIKISSLLDTLHFIVKSGYYQTLPASYAENFKDIPKEVFNSPKEVKLEYFKEIANEITGGKTLAEAISIVNVKPFVPSVSHKEIVNSLQKNGEDLTHLGLQDSHGINPEKAAQIITSVKQKQALENPEVFAKRELQKVVPSEIKIPKVLTGNETPEVITKFIEKNHPDVGPMAEHIASNTRDILTTQGPEAVKEYVTQEIQRESVRSLKSQNTTSESLNAGDPTKITFNRGNAFSEGMVNIKEAQTALTNAGYSKENIKEILGSLADKTRISMGKQSVNSKDLKEAAFDYSTPKEKNTEKIIPEEKVSPQNPAKILNKHFGRSSDTISQQMENAKGTHRSDFIQDKINELGYQNIEEAQTALDEYKKTKSNQGGFIAPGKIAEGVYEIAKKTGTYIEQTNKNIEAAKNLDDTLYRGVKNSEADTVLNHQLQDQTSDISRTQRENILAYRDALEAGLNPPKLTEKEQAINDHLIDPLYVDASEKISYIKKAGVPFSADEYSHRLVKGKGGVIDKLISQKNKIFPKGGVTNVKNILKKSAPQLKHRTMKVLIDAEGNRTVAHIGKQVTAFKNKGITDLGNFDLKKNADLLDKELKPLRNRIKTLDRTIKTLQSVKTSEPVSQKKLDNLRDKISELEKTIAENKNTAHTAIYKSMSSDIAAISKSIDTFETKYKNLKPLETKSEAVAKEISKIEARLSDAYEKESNLALSDIYEQVSDIANKNSDLTDKSKAQLQKSAAELRTLSKIKSADKVVLTARRIKTLEAKLIQAVNEMGNIEAQYNPDELNQKTFTGNNGIKYTIGQATTAEIEQHSNVEYYHDPISAAIFAHDDITRAFRAVQLLEGLKNDPKFVENSFKLGDGLAPEGWKTVNLDQFRGYAFEPHTANVLNAFAQELKGGDDPIRMVTAINNFLLSTMFLSPVKHLLNVGVSSVINRGATRWLNPMAYPVLARTTIASIRSVVTQDADYVKLLRAGVPMVNTEDIAKHRENVLASLGEETNPQTVLAKKALKIGGAITPFHWAHVLTWPGNNMLLQQQIREELAKQGLTIQSATFAQIEKVSNNVTKILPNYRLPVAVRRLPKYVTKNTLLFASYRYNLIKSFFELGKTLLTGDISDQPIQMGSGNDGSYKQSYFGKDAWKNRADAINKIIIMAFLSAIVMPYVDKKIKEFTGNMNAYLSDPGQLSVIDNVNKLLTGQINITQYVQTMVDFAPFTKELLQQFGSGTDWFTGKSITTKGTTIGQQLSDRLTHAENVITPYDLTQKIAGGTMTLTQLLQAQIGIHEPKGNNLINILQGSNSDVINEINRLNRTQTPPSSSDIEKRPDVQIFKAQVTPAKYTEAMKQFTGMFVANMAKLISNQFMKPATATSITKQMNYTDATDAEKSRMIDTVKNLTIAAVEKAYHYNKGTGLKGRAIFEEHPSYYGNPSIQSLSSSNADDGKIEKKNPKGEPIYVRFSVSESNAIRDSLYNSDPYWKDNGYNKTDVQLDHIVPIEGGGSMTKDNLMLISKISDQLNQPFEDWLGKKYAAGTISRANAIKASIDYKINKTISLTDAEGGKY